MEMLPRLIPLTLAATLLQLIGTVSGAASTSPVVSCESLATTNLGSNTTVLSATKNDTADHPHSGFRRRAQGDAPQNVSYCLVKVLVQPSINIWVGLPSDGSWNGRFQAMGGGGYAGSVRAPIPAVNEGYVGSQTDTGHVGGDGSFGMLRACSGRPCVGGAPNVQLQEDFAHRSEHLMAVVSKQLIQAYYGKAPVYSFWNGCSTGGRQGLMMAQRYPMDYDGILSGAPAIHWDKFQAYQIWPQMVMKIEAGGFVAASKQQAATAAAIAHCDGYDGVIDGTLRDPRACDFDANQILCEGRNNATCLTAGEAKAMNSIWRGCRNANGDLMWYGSLMGAQTWHGLAGPEPFQIAVSQPKYWVYFNPDWDWTTLTYENYAAFFDKTVKLIEPVIGTDNADLRAFRDHGGKLIMWHGWADQLIMPQGSIDYYDEMVATVGGGLENVQDFARLFMAPGIAHCGTDTSPFFEAVVQWVEQGTVPDRLPLSTMSCSPLSDPSCDPEVARTRPMCPHPTVAVYKGRGDTNDEANFECGPQVVHGKQLNDTENRAWWSNERVFGLPYVPSGF